MLTLRSLRPGYRFLYAGVLLFMTAATAANTVHQWLRGGIFPGQVAAWYRGNEGDPRATSILFPKPLDEVVNDSWTALFTYTLALVIFGAILHRARSKRAGAALVATYAIAAVVAATAPPLVRYASPALAVPESAALVALPALSLAMTAVALKDMLAPGTSTRESS